MEVRFLKDSLERELKRVQQDVELLRESTEDVLQPEGELFGPDELVHELLRKSDTSTIEEVHPNSKWDLPLPIPIELEQEDRILELLQVCESVFSGLKLFAVKKVGTTTWELSGEANMIEFCIEFQTVNSPGRTYMSKWELKRIPGECKNELAGLIELSKARSCLRTWLVGISEYSTLVRDRQLAFESIRTSSPNSFLDTSQNSNSSELDFYSQNRQRGIRLIWRPKWTATALSSEPNEFLVPHMEFQVIRGFTDEAKRVVEDPEAISGLVRKFGVVASVLAIIKELE